MDGRNISCCAFEAAYWQQPNLYRQLLPSRPPFFFKHIFHVFNLLRIEQLIQKNTAPMQRQIQINYFTPDKAEYCKMVGQSKLAWMDNMNSYQGFISDGSTPDSVLKLYASTKIICKNTRYIYVRLFPL